MSEGNSSNLRRFLGRGCDEALFTETKGFSVKKRVFSERLGKDFYRKRQFSEEVRAIQWTAGLWKWKVAVLIPFPKISYDIFPGKSCGPGGAEQCLQEALQPIPVRRTEFLVYHSFRNHYILNSKTINLCNCNCRNDWKSLRGIISCNCILVRRIRKL